MLVVGALAALLFTILMVRGSYLATYSKNWRYLSLLGGSCLIDLGYLLCPTCVKVDKPIEKALSEFEKTLTAPWFLKIVDRREIFAPTFEMGWQGRLLPSCGEKIVALAAIDSETRREIELLKGAHGGLSQFIHRKEEYSLPEKKLIVLLLSAYPERALVLPLLEKLKASSNPHDRFTWFLLERLGEWWKSSAVPEPRVLPLFKRHKLCTLTLSREYHKEGSDGDRDKPNPNEPWLGELLL